MNILSIAVPITLPTAPASSKYTSFFWLKLISQLDLFLDFACTLMQTHFYISILPIIQQSSHQRRG